MTETYDSSLDTFNHIRDVQENLLRFQVEFSERGINHDDSKLQEPEKSLFDKFSQAKVDFSYDSSEYKQCLTDLKVALDHHYKSNNHHPEHYENGIDDMSLFDIIEMFCDWMAATKRHSDGSIFKSIEANTNRFSISPQLVKILVNTAVILED